MHRCAQHTNAFSHTGTGTLANRLSCTIHSPHTLAYILQWMYGDTARALHTSITAHCESDVHPHTHGISDIKDITNISRHYTDVQAHMPLPLPVHPQQVMYECLAGRLVPNPFPGVASRLKAHAFRHSLWQESDGVLLAAIDAVPRLLAHRASFTHAAAASGAAAMRVMKATPGGGDSQSQEGEGCVYGSQPALMLVHPPSLLRLKALVPDLFSAEAHSSELHGYAEQLCTGFHGNATLAGTVSQVRPHL
jgi:hypothetical protein